MNRGEDVRTDALFTLSEQAQKEIVKLFLAIREEMENKRISEYLARHFWGVIFGCTGAGCSPLRRGTRRFEMKHRSKRVMKSFPKRSVLV